MASIIYNGTPASLPYSFEHIPDSDIEVVVQLYGSAWSQTANTKIGLKMSVDGQEVVSASVFSNGTSTHRTFSGFGPHQFPIKIVDGQIQPVKITIDKLTPATVFDVNDVVTIVVM